MRTSAATSPKEIAAAVAESGQLQRDAADERGSMLATARGRAEELRDRLGHLANTREIANDAWNAAERDLRAQLEALSAAESVLDPPLEDAIAATVHIDGRQITRAIPGERVTFPPSSGASGA